MSPNTKTKYKPTLTLLLSTVLLLSLLPGCGGPGQVVVGREGIVSMGPHITETVFALDQGDRVIAVGSFDDYPPEARDLPKAGGYIDPDFERIAMLRPELVIVAGENPKMTSYARLNRLPLLNVAMDSIATIDTGIAAIGAALGCEAEAEQLRVEVQAGLDAVRASVEGKPRPKVLILTGRQTHDLNTLNTVGGSSFLSELVEIAGGENLYRDAVLPYIEASKETVVVRAPEVILEFHCGRALSPEQEAAYMADWRALSSIPAVRDGRIYLITRADGMRPGPRVPEIARLIAGLLHPTIENPE